MIKLSDYVAQKIVELGVRNVFMVTGGGAMHLNYSFGTSDDLECTFFHHEQACAIAAEAYARINNDIALVNVTSGPGGTNAITGVYGAFVDSIPMVVISGQVKYETTVKSTGLALRQYGDQELDIQELVRPVTKYATMITDPVNIRYHLEKAFFLAKSGRPGPCWLDIPLDVQAAKIDPSTLQGFSVSEVSQPWKMFSANSERVLAEVQQKIFSAKRPVLFVGSGIRLSGQHKGFLELVEKLKIPVVTAWNAHDLIENNHPFYIGRPGTIGDRAGNFAVQNSDVLIILGSRLNIRQVSYNWSSFARSAYKIWVDIDELELKKPSVKPDFPIHADLADFIPGLLSLSYRANDEHESWLSWCRERKDKYPIVLDEYRVEKSKINPYVFMEALFNKIPENRTVVSGNGSACVIGFQTAYIKSGQRFWTNSGCATMGYDLPGAIGAYLADPERKDVISLAGDGSIMMNLQELETIAGNQFPIKIFIINNNGYVSIFQTHKNFFGGEVGGGPNSGVTFPKFEKLAIAFGFPYFRCEKQSNLDEVINQVLLEKGPVICEIIIDETQVFSPKLSSKQLPDGKIISPSLEDLSPFLSREELEANMIILLQSE